MAITWGGWKSSGTQSARVGIDLSISSSETTSTITARYYVEFSQAVNDSMTLSYSEAHGGSTNFTHTGGRQLVHSRTVSRTRQSSDTSVIFEAALSGVYNGVSPDARVGIIVPARSSAVPLAPTNVSASRDNDGRISVEWGLNSTTARPWDEIQVQQWDNEDGWYEVYFRTPNTTSLVNTENVSANKKYRYRVRARNSAGWGSWANSNEVSTTPAAPSGTAVSRSSDYQHTVSWTANYTGSGTDASWNGVELYRWDNESGSYSRIATLGYNETSYTDNSTTRNRQYRYRVRATNGLDSSWSYSATVSTTPYAPSAPSAHKYGDAIIVAWVNQAEYVDSIEVWHAANGVWDSSPLATLSGSPNSYSHSSPDPNTTHRYRLRAKAGTLTSAYSGTSNTVELLQPPNAPSGLSPSSTTVDRSTGVSFTWWHSSADTTEQTAYEVERRLQGSSTWTSSGKVTSSEERASATSWLSNGYDYEWRVRTWGQHSDPSSWSSVARFTTSARPTATVTSPGATLDRPQLSVEWSYYDPEGTLQTQWRATLYNERGDLYNQLSGYGYTNSATFSTHLSDGETYQVGVEVQDGDGMWSEEDRQTFAVEYALPPTPVLGARWDGASAVLTVDNPPPASGEEETTHNEVWRSADPETAERYAELAAALESRSSRGLDEPVINLIPNPAGRATTGSTITLHENLAHDAGVRLHFDLTDESYVGGPFGTTVHKGVRENDAPVAIYLMDDNGTPITGGETYTASFWARSSVAKNLALRMSWDGTSAGERTLFTVPADEWVRVQHTDQAPSGATTAGFDLLDTEDLGVVGDVLEVTGPMLTPGEVSHGPFFNGDYSPDPDLTPEWTGTEGSSPSRLVAQRPSSWVAVYSKVYHSNSRDAVAIPYEADRTDPYTYLSSSSWGGFESGKTYATVAEVRTSDGEPVLFAVYGNQGSYEEARKLVHSGETYRHINTPHGTLTVRATPAPGQTVYFRLAVIEGEYGGGYFDGGLSSGDTEYSWTGEPNESTSVAADATVPEARESFESSWDRTAVEVSSDMSVNGSTTDHIPAVPGRNVYRAVAVTALPSEALSEPVELSGGPRGGVWLNAGPSFSDVVRLFDNVELGWSKGREKVLRKFAGREGPVEFAGRSRSRSGSISWTTSPRSPGSTIEQVEELADRAAPICLRDPFGRRWFVSLGDLDVSLARVSGQLSLPFTVVDHDE